MVYQINNLNNSARNNSARQEPVFSTKTQAGNVTYLGGHPAAATANPPKQTDLQVFSRIFGVILSVAIFIGVVIWGAQTLMRDASGVPVVQSLEGDIRRPPLPEENPDGVLAAHQGLSVNTVTGNQQPTTELPEVQRAPDPLSPNLPYMNALSDMNAEPAQVAVAPLGTELPVAEVAEEPTVTETTVTETEGLRISLRPQTRPANLGETAPSALDIDPATIPAGTRLVQLGAYKTPEMARQKWDEFSAQFGDFFVDKNRVIQEVTNTNGTFYRLRVMGFSGRSDAQRFCNPILAKGLECYPVLSK